LERAASFDDERHGGGLLCGACGAGDGYSESSGGSADGFAGWRGCGAACARGASALPQNETEEKNTKGIGQAQSTSWDTHPQEGQRDDRNQQPPNQERSPATAEERQKERCGASRGADREHGSSRCGAGSDGHGKRCATGTGGKSGGAGERHRSGKVIFSRQHNLVDGRTSRLDRNAIGAGGDREARRQNDLAQD
jgi:hypothetical protein